MLPLAFLAFLLGGSFAAPATRTFVTEYLSKYGYLKASSAGDAAYIREAIKAFQKDVGLGPSGVVSESVLELMKQPRCGNKVRSVQARRRKRFVPHPSKWPRTVLTWKLSDPAKLLKPYDELVIRNTLHRALSEWTTGSRNMIRFVELRDENMTADIDVFFAKGDHNDSLPFDGKNGVVAHGFYPTDSRLHFDAAEQWTLNLPRGINLYQTAVHEIGHLLGLEHSTDRRAVMFPINRPYDPDFQLADDDIRGIRFLYSPWAWRYYLSRYLRRLWRKN